MKVFVWLLDSNRDRPKVPRPSFSQTYEPETPEGLFTASFVDTPVSHDGSAFTVGLEFSEEPASGFSYKTLQRTEDTPSVLHVRNGAVTRAARKVAGENRQWTLTIEPDDAASYVTLALSFTTDCAATRAICTDDGRPLAVGPVWLILAAPTANPGTDQTQAALTVAYETAPRATHDGSTSFTFRFGFSQDLGPDYSYPGGTESRSILLTLWREIPKWRAAARSLIPSRHARRTLRYSSTV